jgi:hypothetical protein
LLNAHHKLEIVHHLSFANSRGHSKNMGNTIADHQRGNGCTSSNLGCAFLLCTSLRERISGAQYSHNSQWHWLLDNRNHCFHFRIVSSSHSVILRQLDPSQRGLVPTKLPGRHFLLATTMALRLLNPHAPGDFDSILSIRLAITTSNRNFQQVPKTSDDLK